jgi:hypothetical protein
MSLECDERAHWHAELAQFVSPAEIGKVDDEAGGEYLNVELTKQLDRALCRPAAGNQINPPG